LEDGNEFTPFTFILPFFYRLNISAASPAPLSVGVKADVIRSNYLLGSYRLEVVKIHFLFSFPQIIVKLKP
jgi:hypothetical protein